MGRAGEKRQNRNKSLMTVMLINSKDYTSGPSWISKSGGCEVPPIGFLWGCPESLATPLCVNKQSVELPQGIEPASLDDH